MRLIRQLNDYCTVQVRDDGQFAIYDRKNADLDTLLDDVLCEAAKRVVSHRADVTARFIETINEIAEAEKILNS